MQLPAEFDLDQAKSVFEGLRTMTTVAERLKAFCMECVGLPYAENPLTGDSQTSEELTCSLASYDCVTLVETALSFALALTPQEAISILTQIRYSEGHIAWTARNHYMHNWITNGERHARVSRVRFRGSEKIKECTLSCIKELLAEQISFP